MSFDTAPEPCDTKRQAGITSNQLRLINLENNKIGRASLKRSFKTKMSVTAKFVLTGLVASLIIAAPASAQQVKKRTFGPNVNNAPLGVPQKKPVPPEIISKNGKWVVQCEGKKPVAGAPPRSCAMVQLAKNKQRPNIAVSLIIGKVKQGNKTATMMRVIAPVGVFLPTGIALEVDGKAVGRVPFTRCLPQACMAFAEARKETLARMKKGNKAKFLIYEAPGVGIPLDLDLTGFSAAFKALETAR
jgi:invasion protein IalB